MIDLATLKEWLAVEDDEHDALLTELEARAVAFIEQETGRHFGESAEQVEFLCGRGRREMWLREKPVGEVTVEREVVEDDGVTWEAVASSKYQVRGYQLIHNSGWGGDTYRVTYDAGYEAGEEPEDIKQAVLDLCSLKFGARKASGFRSESIGGYSYTLADVESVPGLSETLRRWRWVCV